MTESQQISRYFDDPRMTTTFDTDKQKYIVIMNGTNCVEFQINDIEKHIMIKSILRCAEGIL